jgi:hypothetical protein
MRISTLFHTFLFIFLFFFLHSLSLSHFVSLFFCFFIVDDKFTARAKLENGIVQLKLVHQHVVFGAILISQRSTDVNSIFKVSVVMSYLKENCHQMKKDSRFQFKMFYVDQMELHVQNHLKYICQEMKWKQYHSHRIKLCLLESSIN